MLAVVLLMLAVLTFIIYRILSGAYRRVEEDRLTVAERQVLDDVSTIPKGAAKSSTTIFTDIPEQKTLEGTTTFEALTSDPQTLDHDNEEDLPYADPVDGMPFEPGESIVPCVCGLAYREDSVKWLADCQGGCCIHCGATVSLPQQRS
jgi:hypothetical protein